MPDVKLRVNDPQGRRFVALDKELFTIGRRTAADLQIVSTDVSREHAEIVRDGIQYILRDRGSRYGTFVNGEPVTERALLSGDRIRLGRTEAVELVFQGTRSRRAGSRQSARHGDRHRRISVRWRASSTACARSAPAACSARC